MMRQNAVLCGNGLIDWTESQYRIKVNLPSHLRIFPTSPYGCHISVKVHGLLRSGRFYERFTSN